MLKRVFHMKRPLRRAALKQKREVSRLQVFVHTCEHAHTNTHTLHKRTQEIREDHDQCRHLVVQHVLPSGYMGREGTQYSWRLAKKIHMLPVPC